MSSLQVGDYRKLLELVAQLLQHQGPGFPDTRVTALLRETFQAEFAGAGKVDFRGTGSYTWSDSPRAYAWDAGYHDYAVRHPIAAVYRRTGKAQPLRASDVPAYRRPDHGVDMSRLLAIPLVVTPAHVCAIALRRDRADFTDLEVELAAELRPVLSAAYALRDQFGPAVSAPFDTSAGVSLTPRELAVLQLMAGGLIARAIARRLGISPHTVGKHIENIHRKLGTHDRATTVLRARSQGCLPP